tara:strand:- start:1035 stop:1214 length:180 start_codon:yes stop_codon:yes gene_type:complete
VREDPVQVGGATAGYANDVNRALNGQVSVASEEDLVQNKTDPVQSVQQPEQTPGREQEH